MSNLTNFTNDERSILSLLLAKDVLLNQLSKQTDFDYQKLDDSLAISTGNKSAKLSDDQVREMIADARGDYQKMYELLNKNTTDN